jgi:hypothetical protein
MDNMLMYVRRWSANYTWCNDALTGSENPFDPNFDLRYVFSPIPANPVAPGATMTIPVVLRAGPPGGMTSLTPAELIGTFRVRVPAYPAVDKSGYPIGAVLNADALTTPTFTVAP